ncbi:hypothetical protein K437DRAFT_181894 [Tilletiaria anomala UBC 951]|uniref:Protein kinase domain-containing protein n=1 Tax=Tilletiaria anomala (strain ATCC 24038 / CBS 436.72 / UBC 951) TaxID=1037660 RepID=A0A066VQQ0_TILAU|nr:uncharacterized protein K437DRAFT_181894 [Tilletiaria anomala UBC 951]KDN40875.1 hypothetical protein K437DRAFT_181894 [Tilletiaria anomala UBC 951]
MPVLEQFKNFIRHGKAAKDGYGGSHRYDGFSNEDDLRASMGSNMPIIVASGSPGHTQQGLNPSTASHLPPFQPSSGAATSGMDTTPVVINGGAAGVPNSNGSCGSNSGVASVAAAVSNSNSRNQPLPSPGAQAHKDVAAQIVQEEREASEKMPSYEGLTERFVLLMKMGDGAFSNVYKARDRKTGQKVAIKVVRKFELSSNQVSYASARASRPVPFLLLLRSLCRVLW